MFKAFQASSPEVEVDGRTIVAVTGGILVGAVTRELLAAEFMEEISEGCWYPQQHWLSVYRRIFHHMGADTLYSIGRRIPYAAKFPDEHMHDVPTALQAINVAYHHAHRGGEIGHYLFAEAGPDHYEIHCDNPYPNEFDLGLISSLVERFRGRNTYRVGYRQAATDPEVDNACVVEIVRI